MEKEEKEKESGRNTEKENIQYQSEINEVITHNRKYEQTSSTNLLNNPSDFILVQNPLNDLNESNSAIIHIKNTCKNSFFNCYVYCCFGYSIIYNTF